MIRNYIKVSFRTLWKNKLSTITNILGLSISMVIGVLLFAMVKTNWETDHFHPQIEKTFRVLTEIQGENNSVWATSPPVIADNISRLTFVEKTTLVRHGGVATISTENGTISNAVTFSEPSFFKVFGFQLLSGDSQKVLNDPNSVLISEATSMKLFGTLNTLGMAVKFDGWGNFLVGGVIKKPVLRTHLPIDIMFSLKAAQVLEKKNLIPGFSNDWKDYKNYTIYVQTNEPGDGEKLNKALKKISNEINKRGTEKYSFSAQNIEEITPWNPAIKNDLNAGMHREASMMWVFLALGLTLLAAFNYTALSVATIIYRAKEVGIRKTNGAQQKQIFYQLIIEAVMIAFFALLIAYLVIFSVHQSGGLRIGSDLNIKPDFHFIPILLGYTVITGFIAGMIPAFFLAKFKPVDVLKNLKNFRFVRGIGFYKTIIVVQFSITIMLMIFFVILKDTMSKNHDSLLSNLPDDVTIIQLKNQPAAVIKSEIEQLGQIRMVSLTNILPLNIPSEKCTLKLADNHTEAIVYSAFIDENFPEIFNMKLKAGRNFSEKTLSKNKACALVNESAARLIAHRKNLENDIIGQIVRTDSMNIQIIGILADNAFHSETSVPTIYRFNNLKASFIAVKSHPASSLNTVSLSQKIWRKTFPDFSPEIFNYKEKIISESNAGEAELSLPFEILCGVVMLIACLGILGMATYAVQSDTLPISIRKTFGADNKQILTSVTKPFFKLLLLSGIFGIPLGWFCGNLLKTRFGSHVDLGFSNLLIGFGIVLAIGLAVVISQTFRILFINPVKILRGE